jgi:hypothetical protein
MANSSSARFGEAFFPIIGGYFGDVVPILLNEVTPDFIQAHALEVHV